MADPVTDGAIATAATKGAADAGEAGAAAGGLGDFFGSLFGGGAADAAAGGAGDFLASTGGGIGSDAAFGGAGDYIAGAGAGGIGSDAAASGAGAATLADTGFGGGSGAFDAATAGGGSAFDPATYAGAGGSTGADWLNGASMFDTGVGGSAPDALTGGSGVSSFADTMAAGGSGPVSPVLSSGDAGSFVGSSSAFTPSPDIALPDAGVVDPTSAAATGDASVPANATFTEGQTAAPAGTATNGNNLPLPGQSSFTGPVATGEAPAAAAGASAPASSGNGSFLGMEIGKPTLTGAAGLALSGGLLATNLFRSNVPGQGQIDAISSSIPQIQSTIDNVNQTAAQLRASTAPLTADAQQMMSYVSKGTLPPAMQAQVAAGTEAAIAQAKSVMAQHGLSADPAQNAQLKQQIDTIQSQALQLQGTLAKQLYDSGIQAIGASNQTQSVAASLQNTGIQALGLTNNTYLALQKIYADNDKTQQAAIANFAGALGKLTGGGGGTTIKIGS